jgi:hypothetical protein
MSRQGLLIIKERFLGEADSFTSIKRYKYKRFMTKKSI